MKCARGCNWGTVGNGGTVGDGGTVGNGDAAVIAGLNVGHLVTTCGEKLCCLLIVLTVCTDIDTVLT